MNLDQAMNQFRIASRELFNNFFRIYNPYENDGWILEERFSEIQKVLFRKLVTEPTSIRDKDYGQLQCDIAVKIRSGTDVPIMLNREIEGGYWDHPFHVAPENVKFSFLVFFDWDQLDYRDNRYVRVRVDEWPLHADVVGKHALIESHYVKFEKHAQPG